MGVVIIEVGKSVFGGELMGLAMVWLWVEDAQRLGCCSIEGAPGHTVLKESFQPVSPLGYYRSCKWQGKETLLA